MAWQKASYKLTGEAGLIVHNGRTANPRDKFSKAIKQISGKRKKTDSDYEEIGHLEFLAGLYMGPNGPVIPACNIDAMVIAAAKKSKEGPMAKAGFYCGKDAVIVYDGPKDPEEMWKDGRFAFAVPAKVGQSKVIRTRPKFPEWELTAEVNYEDSICNQAQVDDWFQVAGTNVCLGDWRPQNGRFSVQRNGTNGQKK